MCEESLQTTIRSLAAATTTTTTTGGGGGRREMRYGPGVDVAPQTYMSLWKQVKLKLAKTRPTGCGQAKLRLENKEPKEKAGWGEDQENMRRGQRGQ